MKCPKRRDYPIECIFDLSPGYIIIPLDWTPRQAERIVSIIQLLEEKIWSLYADPIISIYREDCLIDENERCQQDDASLHSCFGEDDIPF
jgi:hypothetical protein